MCSEHQVGWHRQVRVSILTVSFSGEENLPGTSCALAPGLTLTLMFHGSPSSAQTCLRSPIHTRHRGTARRLFALLDGSTEPEVKENQGHTMGEVLEQEAARQTPGEMSQESLQTGSVVRNDSSRCDPIMAHWVTCKAGLHSHTPFPASLLS